MHNFRERYQAKTRLHCKMRNVDILCRLQESIPPLTVVIFHEVLVGSHLSAH